MTGFTQRFNLYCGQTQRSLTEDQISVMWQIAEFVINDGAVSSAELNDIDTDLWRQGIRAFRQVQRLDEEIIALSKIILKAA